MIWINILLLVIAGIFRSLVDLSEEGKLKKSLNKADSWLGKYDYMSTVKYSLSKNPKDLKPRFFLSTTLLVFLTDFWHFASFIYVSSLQLLISVNLFNGWEILISFVVIKTLFSGVAQATRWIVTKKIDG